LTVSQGQANSERSSEFCLSCRGGQTQSEELRNLFFESDCIRFAISISAKFIDYGRIVNCDNGFGDFMDFSDFNQEKSKIFVLLVASFAFLTFLRFAFESFLYNNESIFYIWLILYLIILVFGGVFYGLLTKSRQGAMILGFSFPLLFLISRIISALSPYMDIHNILSVLSYFLLVGFPLYVAAVSNAIACRLVTTKAENKFYHYILSLSFMALSLPAVVLFFVWGFMKM
jgi:hypothetical protein